MKKQVFYNGIFHSMKSEKDTFYAMEVLNGKINRVFSDKDEFDNIYSDKSKFTDLFGMHVYPCLIDSHTHMLLTIAQMAMGFQVCEIKESGVVPNTLVGVEEKIRGYANKVGKNAIIACSNYITSAMDLKRMPTKDELDSWTDNRAIVIYNIDGHSTALSTKMLEMIGIDPNATNGILMGEENERAQGRIIDTVGSKLGIKELAIGISRFHNYCIEYGINMVGALEGNGDSKKDITTKLIAFLAQHFDIKARLYLQYIDYNRVKKFENILKNKRVGGCGDFEMDGSIGSHSASFPEPFIDTKEKAPLYYSQEKVDSIVKIYNEKGYQIASHAIGSLGIHRYLEALSKLNYDKTRPFHRIEHCEFIDPKDLDLLKSLNLNVTMQPGYAYIDKRYLHSYENTLNEKIISNMKLKSIYDITNLSGSSDSPVQDMDPYLQMQGMCDFYIEKESLTPYEALCTYTKNAAICMCEDDYGTLEVGKYADFFVTDIDIRTVNRNEVINIRPCKTYYYGEKAKEYKENSFTLLKLLLKKRKKI